MNIFWFRRDLRLDDNHALFKSLKSLKTLPIFIFDEDIFSELPKNDSRVTFIYDTLKSIHETLEKIGSSLEIYHGKPINVWK
jgi:deoxyribodipyrimidine photo-lyase